MAVEVKTDTRERGAKVEASSARSDVKVRWAIAIGLLVVLGIGVYFSYGLAQIRDYASTGNYGTAYTSTYYVLFTKSPVMWLILASPFLGVLFGAMKEKRFKDVLVDGKIVRHDATGTFLEHWTVALSCMILLATGILLGALFIPRLVPTPRWGGFLINIHQWAVVVFLFGVFYHLTNHLRAGDFGRILPTAKDFTDAIVHYTSKFGIGRHPKEGKYLASQKFAYLTAAILIGLVVVTGVIKVIGNMVSLPAGILGPTNYVHDLSAILMLGFFAIHMLMAVIMPSSWGALKSMFTGDMSVDFAKKEHAQWYEEVQKGSSK